MEGGVAERLEWIESAGEGGKSSIRGKGVCQERVIMERVLKKERSERRSRGEELGEGREGR